jgi:glycosyltransferase involved in cell wall biosynthesis
LSDRRGGAAIAANRVHDGLKKLGIDSLMVVARKTVPDDATVMEITKGFRYEKSRLMYKVASWLGRLQKDSGSFGCSINIFPTGTHEVINKLNPDIVHLHWVGGEVIQIEELPLIKAPLIWTLHDMWPICGAEHYVYDHEKPRWMTGYSRKTRPTTLKGLDWNRWVWQRKQRSWRDLSMTTTSPSVWMRDCAEKSALWKNHKNIRHLHIPNGLDLSVFQIEDKLQARRALGLDEKEPLLLFGAFSVVSHIKGSDLLYAALEILIKLKFRFQVATFGHGQFIAPQGVKLTSLGSVNNARTLNTIYNSANLMIVPSRLETFGQTASEALACGLPVVCFDTTGLKDIVDHKVNGYRAKAFDAVDLAEGIIWCLADKSHYSEMSRFARSKVIEKYDYLKIAAGMSEAYAKTSFVNSKA